MTPLVGFANGILIMWELTVIVSTALIHSKYQKLCYKKRGNSVLAAIRYQAISKPFLQQKNIVFCAQCWLLAMTCCFASSQVMAAESWNSSIIFSAGYSKEKNGCQSPWLTTMVPGTSSCSENGKTYRFAYDYQFTPTWGLEVSYGDLGKAKGSGTTNVPGGGHATWSMIAEGLIIDGTGTLRVSDGLSYFGKLGVVRAHFAESIETTINGAPFHGVAFNGVPTIDEEKNFLTFGFGMQYDFDSSYAIRAQYEYFGSYDIYSAYGVSSPPRIHLSMVSAGLVLKF